MNKKLITLIASTALVALTIVLSINNLVVKKSFNRLKMTSDRVDIIYDYANTLYSQKEFDKAEKAFKIIAKQGIDKEKRKNALLKLTDIYENRKALAEARDCYKKLIEEFPGSDAISQVQQSLGRLNMEIIRSPLITENSFKYIIQTNDTLSGIAKKFNTTVELIRESNNLKSDTIIPGRTLKISKGKLSILVDKSQNLLFLKTDGEIIKTYVVSTGVNNSTPVGNFKIEEKLISPVWYKMGAVVKPDSDEYQLGKYWMGLSLAGYGIHGTNDQSSIGKQITQGCVRMADKDIEELYIIVPSGAEIEIVD